MGRFEEAGSVEAVGHGYGVDGLAAVVEAVGPFEAGLIGRYYEISGCELVERFVGHRRGAQQRADHRYS